MIVVIVTALVILAIAEAVYFVLAMKTLTQVSSGKYFVQIKVDGKRICGWSRQSDVFAIISGRKTSVDYLTVTNRSGDVIVSMHSVEWVRTYKKVHVVVLMSLINIDLR